MPFFMHLYISSPSDAASRHPPWTDSLPQKPLSWLGFSSAALHGLWRAAEVLSECISLAGARPCLGSLCFRPVGTYLLVQLYICQVTVLLMVPHQNTRPTWSQLFCVYVCQFFMSHHPSQTRPCWSWQCAPPCAQEGRSWDHSGSVGFLLSYFLPISYFSHTHAKVSLGILSLSRFLKLWVTTPLGLQKQNVQVVKNLATV